MHAMHKSYHKLLTKHRWNQEWKPGLFLTELIYYNIQIVGWNSDNSNWCLVKQYATFGREIINEKLH